MNYDLLTARRAGVNFIFASYGYGKIKNVKKIKNFNDLLKINE